MTSAFNAMRALYKLIVIRIILNYLHFRRLCSKQHVETSFKKRKKLSQFILVLKPYPLQNLNIFIKDILRQTKGESFQFSIDL